MHETLQMLYTTDVSQWKSVEIEPEGDSSKNSEIERLA